jgi:large subunit ribosomal protein L30
MGLPVWHRHHTLQPSVANLWKKFWVNDMADKELKVTLIKSVSGRLKKHQACVRGLGLRRTNHTVVVKDTPENRGMINKVSYMLSVEEA